MKALLPPEVTDLEVVVRQCHNPHHAHRDPNIEILTCKLFGQNVTIESEVNSGLYNVRIGNNTIVRANEAQVKRWIQNQQIKVTP